MTAPRCALQSGFWRDDNGQCNVCSEFPDQVGQTFARELVGECTVYDEMQSRQVKLWTFRKMYSDRDEAGEDPDSGAESEDTSHSLRFSVHKVVDGLGLLPVGPARQCCLYDTRMFYKLHDLQKHCDISIETSWESTCRDYRSNENICGGHQPRSGEDLFVSRKAYTSAYQLFIRSLVRFVSKPECSMQYPLLLTTSFMVCP